MERAEVSSRWNWLYISSSQVSRQFNECENQDCVGENQLGDVAVDKDIARGARKDDRLWNSGVTAILESCWFQRREFDQSIFKVIVQKCTHQPIQSTLGCCPLADTVKKSGFDWTTSLAHFLLLSKSFKMIEVSGLVMPFLEECRLWKSDDGGVRDGG